MAAKRLAYGNPTNTLDMVPVPPGDRKVFGEMQLKKADPPAITQPGGAKVLAFGNRPQVPQHERPMIVKDGMLTFADQQGTPKVPEPVKKDG